MKSDLTTTRSSLRATAFAACLLALLFGGATACGTEDGATKAKPGNHSQAHRSIEVIEHSKANQAAYLRQLRAEHAAARRAQELLSTGFGDDRRHTIDQQDQDRPPAHHAPGYNKALLAQR